MKKVIRSCTERGGNEAKLQEKLSSTPNTKGVLAKEYDYRKRDRGTGGFADTCAILQRRLKVLRQDTDIDFCE